jgi:hypothetical protein
MTTSARPIKGKAHPVRVLLVFAFATTLTLGPRSSGAQAVIPTSQARALTPLRVAIDEKNPLEKCRTQYTRAKDEGRESYGCIWRYMRLGSNEIASQYFGGMEVGNSLAFRLDEQQTSVYTELLADNLYLTHGLGFTRMGFATQASFKTEADTTTPRTVDQFFQGGGNAILYVAQPLLVWINYPVDTSRGPLRQLNTMVTMALAGDLPALGATATDRAASFRAGFQGDFVWRTHNEVFGIYLHGRSAYVKGLNQTFYTNLFGGQDYPRGELVTFEYSAGLNLAKLVRVGVQGGKSSLSTIESKPKLSVQLIKQGERE